jgi:ABC-type Fe3+/spermidine/putrescine transport system ATPase subunit
MQVSHHIELRGVTKKFGDNLVVNIASMCIEKDEFISFLGPSGCGKTTILRMIAGLETPTTGEILIESKVVNDLEPYKRNISLVFQDFALFPHMTVAQNVAFGLKVRKVEPAISKDKVEKALQLVQIANLGNRRIAQLSGGQRQRVALARALVTDPTVLLLDEPLGSLDAHLRIHMQAELRSLQRRLGIPFICVTHNQNEALSMSDRVFVLKDGCIEMVDTPEAIFTHPSTEFVARFVGKNNILLAEIVGQHNGLKTLRSPLGTFYSRTEGAVESKRMAIVFRADSVRTTPRGGETENSLTGVLSGVDSVGSVCTYLLNAGGEEVRFERHGDVSKELIGQLGKNITVYWNGEDTILLPI